MKPLAAMAAATLLIVVGNVLGMVGSPLTGAAVSVTGCIAAIAVWALGRNSDKGAGQA